MGFNSAFKGLKLLKTPGNGRLINLNDPVLNVLTSTQGGVNGQHHAQLLYPWRKAPITQEAAWEPEPARRM